MFWSLWRQYYHHQYWGNQQHNRQQKIGITIGGISDVFLVLWAFLKYWLCFLNKYWDFLEYVKTESLSVALGKSLESSPEASGSSVLGAPVKKYFCFLVSGVIFKYWLWFLNEYGELETDNPGISAKTSLGAAGEAREEGGLYKLTLSSIVIFKLFCFFWWRWRWHKNCDL